MGKILYKKPNSSEWQTLSPKSMRECHTSNRLPHMCATIYGVAQDTRKAHAEWISKAWPNLHPPGNSSASALASASLEWLSAWNDDRRKWSNDEWIISINIIYMCVHSELFRYIAMVITSFKMATEATYLLCSIGVLWPIWPMVTTSKSPAASKLRVNH